MPMNTDEPEEPAGQVPIGGLSSANAIGVKPGSLELPASPAAVCSRPRRDSLKREFKFVSFISTSSRRYCDVSVPDCSSRIWRISERRPVSERLGTFARLYLFYRFTI